MDWARILAYVTGTVDQELLAPRRELHRRRPRPRKRPLDFRSFPSAIYIRNRQKIGDFTVSNEFRTTLHTPI
jgi:hypothetical protein